MYVHLNSQSSEDTSRENDTFSRILSFLYDKNFWHKIQSVWGVWVVFLCEIFWQAVCRSMNL